MAVVDGYFFYYGVCGYVEFEVFYGYYGWCIVFVIVFALYWFVGYGVGFCTGVFKVV